MLSVTVQCLVECSNTVQQLAYIWGVFASLNVLCMQGTHYSGNSSPVKMSVIEQCVISQLPCKERCVCVLGCFSHI